MNNPKISVIVPVYNAERYLKKCMDSILCQTLKDIEIIIIDDESPDRSGEIADSYALVDSRVKVIHQSNSGPAAARNKGIIEAKGEYIGFVDADDWIEKGMYEKMYFSAKNFNSEVVMCDFMLEFTNPEFNQLRINPKDKIINYSGDEIKELVFSDYSERDGTYLCPLWNKIYKREFLVHHSLLIDERYDHSEDWLFNLNSLCKAERLSYVPEVLYHYMQFNNSSLTKKYRSDQFNIYLDLRKELFNKLETYKKDKYTYKKHLDKTLCYKASLCIYSEAKSKQSLSSRINNIRGITIHKELQEAVGYMDYKKSKVYFNFLMYLIKKRMNITLYIVIKMRINLSELVAAPLFSITSKMKMINQDANI